MKRSGLLLILTLIIVTLLGCQQVSENDKENGINNPETSYSPEEAIKNGDIVNLQGEISNLHKFDSFIQNVRSGTKDEIHITAYTVEGLQFSII